MNEAMKLAIEYYLTDERVSKAVSNLYRQREHEVLRLEKENKELRELVKEALKELCYYDHLFAKNIKEKMDKIEGGQDE